jgi:hypothetical protein
MALIDDQNSGGLKGWFKTGFKFKRNAGYLFLVIWIAALFRAVYAGLAIKDIGIIAGPGVNPAGGNNRD